MLVRIQLLPKGVMLHFMDGRSQHWKHESFSIVRDRESGPIRLMRGPYVLSVVLPNGLLGAFAALMLAAFVSTHDPHPFHDPHP